MTDDTAKRIERAKKLDKAATPGPWRVDEGDVCAADDEDVPRGYDPRNVVAGSIWDPADRRFIAESRTLLPALAADCEDLTAELHRIKSAALPEEVAKIAEIYGPRVDLTHPWTATLLDALRAKEAEVAQGRREIEGLRERITILEARQCYDMALTVKVIRDGDRDVIFFGDGPESWGLVPTATTPRTPIEEVAESMQRTVGRCHDALIRDRDEARAQLAQAERDKEAMRTKCSLLEQSQTALMYALENAGKGWKLERAVAFPSERPKGQSPGEARWAADEWTRENGHLMSYTAPKPEEREHGALVPRESEGSAAAKPREGELPGDRFFDGLVAECDAGIRKRPLGKPREGGAEKAEPSKPRLLPCSVCGGATEWRCADCRLRLGAPVAVCNSRGCQDRHEQDEKAAAGADLPAAHRDAKPGKGGG